MPLDRTKNSDGWRKIIDCRHDGFVVDQFAAKEYRLDQRVFIHDAELIKTFIESNILEEAREFLVPNGSLRLKNPFEKFTYKTPESRQDDPNDFPELPYYEAGYSTDKFREGCNLGVSYGLGDLRIYLYGSNQTDEIKEFDTKVKAVTTLLPFAASQKWFDVASLGDSATIQNKLIATGRTKHHHQIVFRDRELVGKLSKAIREDLGAGIDQVPHLAITNDELIFKYGGVFVLDDDSGFLASSGIAGGRGVRLFVVPDEKGSVDLKLWRYYLDSRTGSAVSELLLYEEEISNCSIMKPA